MRGAPAAVEQPGLGDHEGTGADGQQPGAPGVGGDQGIEHRLGNRLVARHRRDADQIGGIEPLQAVLDVNRQAGQGGHHLAGHGCADGEVKVGNALVLAVDSPGLAQHAELEGGDAVVDQHGNVGEHPVIMAGSWQKIEVGRQNCH